MKWPAILDSMRADIQAALDAEGKGVKVYLGPHAKVPVRSEAIYIYREIIPTGNNNSFCPIGTLKVHVDVWAYAADPKTTDTDMADRGNEHMLAVYERLESLVSLVSGVTFGQQPSKQFSAYLQLSEDDMGAFHPSAGEALTYLITNQL